MSQTAKKDELYTVQILRNVRLLWPALYELPVIEGQKQDKYSTKLILHASENREELQQLRTNMKAVAVAEFGSDDLTVIKNLCLRKLNFEGLEDEDNLYELMAKSKSRPFVVDRDGASQIPAEESDRLYSGVRCNVKIDLWAVENKWGKTLSANLHAVQFVRDDTPIVGGRMSFDKAIDGFEDVAANDDDGGVDDFLR